MKNFSVISFLVFSLACSFSSASDKTTLESVPALNNPASELKIPGKFIFADYFTSDITAAKAFYGNVFGWQWRWITADQSYGMFYQGDVAIAGVALRESSTPNTAYGRWIHYLSTGDVAAKVAAVSKAGGRVLLEPQTLPDRGILAVVADADGAPFGLLNSSSGDPADYRSEVGEWLWVSLFSNDVKKAAHFYQNLLGYEVIDAEDTDNELDVILSKNGYARAGIGQLPESSESHPSWLGYIYVDNVTAYLTKAVAQGAEVLVPPNAALMDGKMAVIADPLGAPIALINWSFGDKEQAQ